MNKQSTNTHTLLKKFNENISGNMRQNVAMTIDKINKKKIASANSLIFADEINHNKLKKRSK